MINVLLADDHAVVRDGLKAVLQSHGEIQVVGDASNGREAVLRAERLHPDVVVMDITMPELNGIDAIPEVREVSPNSQIVILSMHSNSEYVLRALEAGALAFVLKESAAQEVIQAVQAVHAGRRYLSQALQDTLITHALQQHRASPLDALSARERQVLQLIAEGKSTTDIAAILSLSPKSVETYRSRMMAKLEIADLPALVRFAIRHGLIQLQ